jgi:hypothetical protein
VRLALAQDALRERAREKFPEADRLLFTREALEQATPREVAAERAGRWPGPPTTPLHDLGAGIGADAIAAALAGRPVVAWERDPVRALLLRWNLAALGLADRCEVRQADFGEAAPGGPLAFLDPDRRPGGRRTRAPEEFDPPASAWPGILSRFDAAIVKVPPVFPSDDRIPFEVVSLGSRLRERRLFFGAHAVLPPRRALALPRGEAVEGTGVAWPDPRAPVEGDWLLDPDPAVTVARLVGDLARREGLRPVHPRIAYLIGAAPSPAPGTWLRIDALLPSRASDIQRWLDARSIGHLVVRARGISDPPETWARRLRPRGDRSASLVLFRDPSDRWRAAASLHP